MSDVENPLGLNGIEFVEFSSPHPAGLERLFLEFGFSKLMRHAHKNIVYFNQGDIHFLLNMEPNTQAASFARQHGPCICAMGWRVENAERASRVVRGRGAVPSPASDYLRNGRRVPALDGIGGSLIYLVEPGPNLYQELGFVPLENPVRAAPKGFTAIDHLTNNVVKGQMRACAEFYKSVFGFTEVRYFDIRGAKTGLQSYALRSPCGKFCIPINEGTEEKSQINEYLEEYKGPGIQHLAFLTDDILTSLDGLKGSSIETLNIEEDYYRDIFKKFPQVSEDPERIKAHNVLVDGDENGYLLQIFTRNLIGPIFFEVIQRKNHLSFGEGNFGALFRSIERDQERRGVL